jgi:4-amino-4-deoxy-L-arabinose transferase-like glycosyltransferase
MLTDVPLVTGFAVAGCGFVLARSRTVLAGILIGCGTGIGFLSKGVLAPGVLGITAVLLPLLFRDWRDRRYFNSLGIALVVALPWLLIWPIALYLRSQDLFMEWFWDNNIGRFFGFSVSKLGAPHQEGFWRETLPWFTFPALPLALLTIWQKRSSLLREAPMQFALLNGAVMMSVLITSASARPNYALPLLFPLALLAAPAVTNLSQKISLAWDWAGRLLFGMLALALWWIWVSMMVHHVPPHIEWLGRILPLDFVPTFETLEFIAALLLTAGLIALWLKLPNFRARGLIGWVSGLALCWGLISTLWLPWIDAAKSYRAVYLDMGRYLPPNHGCIASINLNESERGMLRYFLGILTQRREIVPKADCPLLLVDGLVSEPPSELKSNDWKLLWHGARQGDTREQFWLFSKNAL